MKNKLVRAYRPAGKAPIDVMTAPDGRTSLTLERSMPDPTATVTVKEFEGRLEKLPISGRSSKMKYWRTAVRCVAAVFLMAASAAAQTVTGEIRGTVRDTSGGVLPGVTVTVTNSGTGLTRTDTTNDTGTFVFPSLPIGTYSVTAELQGFRKAERTGFVLNADGRVTADFSLGVGAITETVTVEAIRGDTVNRTSGELARVVDGETVRSLALSGRNYLELASLIPGAITTADDQMAVMTGLGTGDTIINGNRGNSNNLTVDGGFNLDSGSNGSMINNVSIDFIDQVAIQTSNFSADMLVRP